MAKYTEGNDERQGIIPAEKTAALDGKRPIWVHAVSVGETQAAVPFIRAARNAGCKAPIVLSTTTQTGKAMAFRLGEGLFDIHIYYPWDRRVFVERALDTLKPAAFITAETELWPNMLWECRERGIPSFLINGRISDRTWKRISKGAARGAAKYAYSLYTAMFMRDPEDAARLSAIGIQPEKIQVTGDSKTDALLARKNEKTRTVWLEKFASPERPIFIAGSTHTGEDEIALAAFEILRKDIPNARLIIAPRHPERAAAVLNLVPRELSPCTLSDYKNGWDALIIDRIGVLFELYGTACAAFVGGSLTNKGGQNILEPFLWGTPVQFGPHMEDFAQAARAFTAMGAASRVENAEELADAWRLAAENTHKDAMRKMSEDYFAASSGASERTWSAVDKIIKSRLED